MHLATCLHPRLPTDSAEEPNIISSYRDIEDSRVLEQLIKLGKNKIISIETAGEVLYDWVIYHEDHFDQDYCEAIIFNSNTDKAERSIAAIALAGSRNTNRALRTLQAAYDNELDPDVKYYFQISIDNIMENITNPIQ